ncbi:MAG TPA: hypothetical protein VF025_02110 [Gaiellaceae bacterium]
MDESIVERARERVEQRADGAALESLALRIREQVDALVTATSGLEQTLPARVGDAVRDQAQPVGRNLAEIRGLMNQVIRRLERAESDLLAERHARVDDLALLVDLVSSGWESVDARLERLEAAVARIDQGLRKKPGANVYRIDEHRPDAASS